MAEQNILTSAGLPDPNQVFPNEYKTSCFVKNVVKAPNVFIGDYTYYDDSAAPTEFEKNNILFNYPQFGEKLVIGKFCQIASAKAGIYSKMVSTQLKASGWKYE